jgi:hypothetical protein
MRGAVPNERILMKLSRSIVLDDGIKFSKFHVCGSRVSDFWGSENCCFPYESEVVHNTVLSATALAPDHSRVCLRACVCVSGAILKQDGQRPESQDGSRWALRSETNFRFMGIWRKIHQFKQAALFVLIYFEIDCRQEG